MGVIAPMPVITIRFMLTFLLHSNRALWSRGAEEIIEESGHDVKIIVNFWKTIFAGGQQSESLSCKQR